MPPALFVCNILLSVTVVFGQTSPSLIANPQAADSVLSQADAAFRGSVTVTDIQLQGTVTSYAGSTKRSGSATLLADNQGHSKSTYAFGDESGGEYASGYSEAPDCQWTGSDGVKHPAAVHNCWIPGNWFLPALSYQAGRALSWSDVGAETRQGISIEHLSIKRTLSTTMPAVTQTIQELSAAELLLDSTSLLPGSLEFKIHPNDDFRTSLAVEIKYSDYRQTNGVKVPFHIQRLVNGSLALDIVLSSVAVNTGLTIQK